MTKTLRRVLATAATVGVLAAGALAGATTASAQSGGDYNQALSDVNSGDAWVVNISDSGIYSHYQFGYGDFFGTYTVEAFTVNTFTSWYTFNGATTHHWNELDLPVNPR